MIHGGGGSGDALLPGRRRLPQRREVVRGDGLARQQQPRAGVNIGAAFGEQRPGPRILRVGAPQAMEIAGMWLIHAFGIRVIANLSSEGALGAHILAIRVESMSFLPGFAIATAAATLAGQYLGAGSPRMAARAVRVCWALAAGMMSLIGVLFVVARYQLIGWMAPASGIHLHLAAPLLVVCAMAQPFFGTCIVLKTSMRGAGATGTVMRWSFGSMLFYRVGMLWWFSHTDWFDLTGVWIVLSVDLFTQALVFAWLHFRGTWLHARV